ncbi:hypothetical protein F4561_006376 [Lipingzhangella halophila]|uniref:Uncharacterized protein n=1 Tax=Lipingzhangella halophila TaxID=1783352 RepID=A0A7W7RPG6_9ACTN|nr:hypothetical protein [Lipingzhangella halophila]MBB4935482.1 hypothetical protein [Lipingzhangella halophila]
MPLRMRMMRAGPAVPRSGGRWIGLAFVLFVFLMGVVPIALAVLETVLAATP